VFWVPKDARWSHLQNNAKQATIGTLIDDAMSQIEKSNPASKRAAQGLQSAGT
jgi:type I restriction enzyme M protein